MYAAITTISYVRFLMGDEDLRSLRLDTQYKVWWRFSACGVHFLRCLLVVVSVLDLQLQTAVRLLCKRTQTSLPMHILRLERKQICFEPCAS